MKLTTNVVFAPKKPINVEDAVEYVADGHAENYENRDERMRARVEALQGMLGRLLGCMVTNGQLRPEQVSEVFGYDVIAELDA